MARYGEKKKHSFLKNVILIFSSLAIAVFALYLIIQNLGCVQDMVGDTLYPMKYQQQVDRAAETYNLEKPLIYAVIRTESHFDPEAESHVGAVGLMQLMPESFEWLQGLRGQELDMSELNNPDVNIDYGCYLLRYFYDYYGSEETAVAAYNAGFVVGDWLKDPNYSSDGKSLDAIPYGETERYVEKVMKAKKMYKKLYFSEK